MKYIFLLFILIISSTISFTQVNHLKSFQSVLKEKNIGKEYSFSQNNNNIYDSLVLIYLGEIKTAKGRILRILTSRWYWGLSPRATSRIILFNEKNQYLGDYYLTMTYDIPSKIENDSLVFINNKESNCTNNLVTRISFKKGIPKQFFRKCKEKSGDIYSFEQNL